MHLLLTNQARYSVENNYNKFGSAATSPDIYLTGGKREINNLRFPDVACRNNRFIQLNVFLCSICSITLVYRPEMS